MELATEKLIAERNKVEAWLNQLPGVTGTGIGLDAGGSPRLTIYTNRASNKTKEEVIARLGNVPVQFEETGEFRAF